MILQTKKNGRSFFIALMAYLLLIFVLSHVPGQTWQKLDLNLWDKLVHFFEYMPVGVLLAAWLLSGYLKELKTGFSILILFALIVVAGVGDELHQHFVPGRQTAFGDVIADTLGGSVGVICTVLILKWRRSEQRIDHG